MRMFSYHFEITITWLEHWLDSLVKNNKTERFREQTVDEFATFMNLYNDLNLNLIENHLSE